MEDDMIDFTRLTRGRGWTAALVEQYLGKEDVQRPNPYRRDQGMREYRLDRVLQAEQREDVQLALRTIAAGKNERATVSRRRLAMLRQELENLICTVDVDITRISIGDLRERAIASYIQWKVSHPGAKGDLDDEDLLRRIMISFVRRELIDYRSACSAFDGAATEAEVYHLLRDRVATETLIVYPELAVPTDKAATPESQGAEAESSAP